MNNRLVNRINQNRKNLKIKIKLSLKLTKICGMKKISNKIRMICLGVTNSKPI